MNDLVDSQDDAREHVAFAPASWLRWLGAISFIGAGAAFLVEGWTDPSIVKRQALWGAGTLIMTLLGIVVARRFRDALGARVFLGLAAATIPAHFAQLGSAVYDLREASGGSLGAVVLAGLLLLLLLPPMALGMSALIRRRARTLTGLMFLCSAPLVIPSRDPAVIALIAGAHVALWLTLEASLFRSDPLFDSVEGVAARIMLLSPAAILLVRNGFHGQGDVWLAAVLACPAVLALVWPKLRSHESVAAIAVQLLGVSGLCAAGLVLEPPLLSLMLVLSSVLLIGAELVVGRPAFLAWSALSLFIAAAALGYADHGWATSLALIPLGTLHALAAFRQRQRWLFAISVLATFAGAIAHLVQLVAFPKHDIWIAGAVLSVALLALASLLESRKAQIVRMTARLQRHFSAE